jgi:mono/diheme cytochrome c family protein
MEIPVKYLIVALALAASPSATYAQEKDQPKKTVERVPITATATMDGHEMFTHYCAVCHGADAKGTGPAADALKKTPADLTQIARKNGGKFPEVHVMRVIKGNDVVSAHGSLDMPVWGELFRSLHNQADAGGDLGVNALMRYVEQIQAK